jgi:undecaprenyl pyrophosphate synthase
MVGKNPAVITTSGLKSFNDFMISMLRYLELFFKRDFFKKLLL